MIRNSNPILQAFVGSLFTWGLTALGAGCVALVSSNNKKFLDCSLGFAAGVMTAASFWSLLAPAIEITTTEFHSFAFVPVSLGFIAGAAFVFGADKVLPLLGIDQHSLINGVVDLSDGNSKTKTNGWDGTPTTTTKLTLSSEQAIRFRKKNEDHSSNARPCDESSREDEHTALSWRRILLLIVAITVHNIPEGMAVGVGFGAIGKSATATFESACSLALGIGIQNFPEGLAVSLPLAGFGFSKWRAFWYGQLSGMVEPAAALLGAGAISLMEPLLPYALSFAAGAMIYVVIDDIIPEAQVHGNGQIASWGAIVGFVVMMGLDVSLG